MSKKEPAKKKPAAVQRRQPGSMADRINSLEVGQSVSVAERIPFEGTYSGGDVREALNKMRSGMGAYVGRITEDLDARVFKIESGCFLTDDKMAVIAAVAVTRVE